MEYMAIQSKKLITPLEQEVTHYHLSIEGTCPEWLHGTFVRNGPVSMEIDGKRMSHWFDGLAMLHSFTFQPSNRKTQLSYSNKFLKTDAFNSVFKEGNFNYLGFDTSPKYSILKIIKTFLMTSVKAFKGFIAFYNPKSSISGHSYSLLQNSNVNLVKIAHHYCALTETPLPVRFDLKTAETLGALDFQDDLPKKNIFESAHPQLDRRTQEKFNYLVDFGFKTQYVIYRYHPELPSREVIAKIPVSRPSYMHSFAMTENYFVLVEFPLIVNPIDLLLMNKPFIRNYYWKPERGTQFLIIDRKTGSLVKKIKDSQPFFAFHHVNAYEENEHIILDIVTYPDANVIFDIAEHGYLSSRGLSSRGLSSQGGEGEKTLNETKLMRYRLLPSLGKMESTVLFAGPFELPRINEQYSAYSYRYVYGSDQRVLIHNQDLRPIYKIDIQTQQILVWQEPGLLPGEPVFIPRPEATEEDDGVVVSVILDAAHHNEIHHKAFLLILDAKTFKEIGRAYAPFTIHVGLHGQFFS